MTDERRYSEDELRAIFARAARRQDEADRAEAASTGQLTLAELQEIGAASGIDPAHVAAAAGELAAGPPEAVPTFLGAPTEVERTRLLPGPVSDEAWARMVAEVRRTFGADGSAGQIGPIREWTAIEGRRRSVAMRLALEPTGGGTRVMLRQSVRRTAKGLTTAAALYAAVALLFLALATAGVDPAFRIVGMVMAGLALAVAGGARGWLGYWGPRQEQRFDGVLDRLELIARDDTPAAEAQAVASTGRLGLDALPDVDEPAGSASRRRTRS